MAAATLATALTPASAALGAAAATAVGLYANAKWGLAADVRTTVDDRAFGKRLAQRMAALGDNLGLYRMLELVDQDRDALWFEGRSWTWAQVKHEADRLADVFAARGVNNRDTVAVFMTNSPEMVLVILALAKLGAIPALLNAALRGDTLIHCVKLAGTRLLVSTPDLASFAQDIAPRTSPSFHHLVLNLYSFNSSPPLPDTATLTTITASSLPLNPKPQSLPKTVPPDTALLMYTSGTTGFPKACRVTTMLLLVVSTPTSLDVRDPARYLPPRFYAALPLFHGTCFFTGLAYSLGTSGCFCFARRFSASNFFRDVAASRATRIIYVGELCRYLLATKPGPYDRAHRARVAQGNGLRGEIWEAFKARFAIPEIREYYRSTEGIAKYDNHGPGAWGAGKVGFQGPLRHLLETETLLVRYDPATQQPWRDPKTGFCVRARTNEPGEAIGRVRSRATMIDYFGDVPATEKKLLRGVFAPGDLWQRTGDLLVLDGDGWIQFVDRTGDTFRWKGENVSAGEVRDVLGRMDGVRDAVVFGVKLPSYDGQAGGCVITLVDDTDAARTSFINSLYPTMKAKGVPLYAMPRLVRFKADMTTGATFKQSKEELKKLPWSPSVAGPGEAKALFWLDGTTYRPLDHEAWATIERGGAKL